MNRGGWMIVADSKGRERERHQIVYGPVATNILNLAIKLLFRPY